jgi:hypothetical protein
MNINLLICDVRMENISLYNESTELSLSVHLLSYILHKSHVFPSF